MLRAVLAANKSKYRILIRSDRLTEAVRFGIPPELRPPFWCVLCNVDGRKTVKASSSSDVSAAPASGAGSKSLYDRLLHRGESSGSLFQLAMLADLTSRDSHGPDDGAVQRLLSAFYAFQKSAQSKATLTPFGTAPASAKAVDVQYHPALRHITTCLLTQLPEEDVRVLKLIHHATFYFMWRSVVRCRRSGR